MMETTLNISTEILEKITRAAQSYGISRSDMVTFLIKKVMDDIPDPARLGRMVRYQMRRKPEDWSTFHLQLRVDDYEYFLDLRKLLKMSVSLILAYAVNKFLIHPLKMSITDNYQFRNYIVAKEVYDDVICWKFIWGIPRNIDKIFQL